VLHEAGHTDAGEALAAAERYVQESAALVGDDAMLEGYLARPLVSRVVRGAPEG
jgi:hypothetical protein